MQLVRSLVYTAIGAISGLASFCGICLTIYLVALYVFDTDLDRTPPPHGYETAYSYTVLSILSLFVLSGALIGLRFARQRKSSDSITEESAAHPLD